MTYCMDWQLDPALGLRVPVIDLECDADARRALANAATIESYALLQMLQREQQREREEDMFEYVFATTIRRLLSLNSAVCSALGTGPCLDPLSSIADMIFGSDSWRDSRDPGDTGQKAEAGHQTPGSETSTTDEQRFTEPTQAAVAPGDLRRAMQFATDQAVSQVQELRKREGPARSAEARHQQPADTDEPRDDAPLLADPARAAIVSAAILELFDKLHEMNEAIGPDGRGGRARQVWTAGFAALERRASVILSAVDDSLETTPKLKARLAALPRVMTEQERGDARDAARVDLRPAERAERRS